MPAWSLVLIGLVCGVPFACLMWLLWDIYRELCGLARDLGAPRRGQPLCDRLLGALANQQAEVPDASG